jgi:hypothetical protein
MIQSLTCHVRLSTILVYNVSTHKKKKKKKKKKKTLQVNSHIYYGVMSIQSMSTISS